MNEPMQPGWKPGAEWRFAIGDEVHKPRNSHWEGKVVGFYITADTPRGYNVQAPGPRDNGSTQIWPETALERSP